MKALESESARLFRLLAEWRRLSPESMLLSHSCQMGRQQTQLKQTNKSNKCKTMEEAILQLVIFVVVEEFHSHPLPAALPPCRPASISAGWHRSARDSDSVDWTRPDAA